MEKITKLQKLYIKFLSYFVVGKQNKRDFRNNKIENIKNKNRLLDIAKYLSDSIYIYGPAWPANDIPKTIEEYEQNKNELLKNLDEEARNNCLNLINKTEKTLCNECFLNNIFSQDELIKIKMQNSFMSMVKNMGSYYQLYDYKLPINHFDSSIFYYEHGINTLKTFNKLGNKAIIDVGCFVADSCLVFRKYTKNKIYTFEPVLENYKLAQKTIELNNLQDVVLENLALGDKEEESEITANGMQSSILHVKYKNNKTEKIKTTTLDKYVKDNNIEVGLIKVDIEGFEPYFLRGAVETIKEQKPIILLSIYHNYHDFFKLKPFIENLDCGYKFDFYQGPNGHVKNETLLICEVY